MHTSLLILCAFAAPAAFTPAPQPVVVEAAPRNTITVGLGSHFALQYERAVHPQASVFVGPALFAGYTSISGDARSELGVGGQIGARFFITGLAPEGLFVSPSLTLSYARLLGDGEKVSGLRIASGAMLGYTWIFGNALDVSLGAGANYIGLSSTEGNIQVPGPLEASMRIAMGVAF